MTLTDFLLARIAEDEAVAREAEWREPYGSWEYAIVNQSGRIQSSVPTGTSGGWVEHLAITHDSEGLSDSVSDNAGPHIARHDPARVLAECEAKRRIVEAFEEERVRRDIYNRDYDSGEYEFNANDFRARLASNAECRGLEIAILALVQPYASHPDYREEWRP